MGESSPGKRRGRARFDMLLWENGCRGPDWAKAVEGVGGKQGERWGEGGQAHLQCVGFNPRMVVGPPE